MQSVSKKSGQSVVEVIMALGIFALILGALISMATGGFLGLTQGGEQTKAQALAQQGIEAVRTIHDDAWNRLKYSTSSVSTTTGSWQFSGEGTTETIGQFTRTISFHDVCRDILDEITTCPGDYADAHTKDVLSSVSWDIRSGVTNTVEARSFMTTWDSSDFTQTDWFGGEGQTEWSDTTKFDSYDDNVATTTAGGMKLLSRNIIDGEFNFPVASDVNWPFTTAGSYIYDSSDIQVVSGSGQLKQIGGSVTEGDTTNPDFETGTTGWTYTDWEETSGANVLGVRVTSGGNPTAFINISTPGEKNATLSGFWEQSFTTTVSNPAIATTTFDWSVINYSGDLMTSYKLYVFVDSFSGTPTVGTEAWDSGEVTSTTTWIGSEEVDISTNLGASGTYYLKIALRTITTGGFGSPGTNTIGFDNVLLHWENTIGGSYSTDNPDIYPTSSFNASGIGSWNSFTETATKNGGEIYYQLSNDDGSTWQYWTGSQWDIATSTQYNTASIIDSNIGTFTTVNEKIMPRAFLESDGTQLVKLDNINISFTAPTSVWLFSTWDDGAGEVTPIGTYNSSGGNPVNYFDITVSEGGGDELGGYVEQQFETFANTPTPVTIDFDYKVVDFNDIPILVEVRTFIDTASGVPVNQISSTTISAEGGWTSNAQISAESFVPTAGVYYLKVGLWVETPAGGGINLTGPFTIGFDNIDLDLGNGEYKTSGVLTSSALDMSDNSPVQIIEWDENVPSCSPACTVKFEVSSAPDLGGSPGTFTSWYGESGVGTFFTNASGTRISTDLNGNQWVRYRATFAGDGDDTVVVDEVRVNYR